MALCSTRHGPIRGRGSRFPRAARGAHSPARLRRRPACRPGTPASRAPLGGDIAVPAAGDRRPAEARSSRRRGGRCIRARPDCHRQADPVTLDLQEVAAKNRLAVQASFGQVKRRHRAGGADSATRSRGRRRLGADRPAPHRRPSPAGAADRGWPSRPSASTSQSAPSSSSSSRRSATPRCGAGAQHQQARADEGRMAAANSSTKSTAVMPPCPICCP